MFSWVQKAFSCVKKKPDDDDSSDDDRGPHIADNNLWSLDLERHLYGEFSLAVAQANEVLQGQSRVEVRRDLTFVGVFDGHGGPDASRHLCNNLFNSIIRLYEGRELISVEILRFAIFQVERWFMRQVRATRELEPLKAGMGSSCLVGVIYRGTLYVANVGDSRIVIGCLDRPNRIRAEQLTDDHNVNVEQIRREVKAVHRRDPNIVVNRQGKWLIKGIIQVSRSIGDAYLKYPELALGPAYPQFHPAEPISCAVLSSEPQVHIRRLQPTDQFLIFASAGLWEHITNQAAVETVHRHPHTGIARRLVKKALKVAARKARISYNELKGKEKGNRRDYHDDITVAVIFIEHELLGGNRPVPVMSLRGFPTEAGASTSGEKPVPSRAVTRTAGPSRAASRTAGPSRAVSGTSGQSNPGADAAGQLNPGADTDEESSPMRRRRAELGKAIMK